MQGEQTPGLIEHAGRVLGPDTPAGEVAALVRIAKREARARGLPVTPVVLAELLTELSDMPPLLVRGDDENGYRFICRDCGSIFGPFATSELALALARKHRHSTHPRRLGIVT